MALTKIVSDGQTGVDRGALDAALAAVLFGASCLTPRVARGIALRVPCCAQARGGLPWPPAGRMRRAPSGRSPPLRGVVASESEDGCLSDEIGNLVRPAERQPRGEPHAGERRHREVAAGPQRSRMRSVAGLAGPQRNHGRWSVAEGVLRLGWRGVDRVCRNWRFSVHRTN
jgi:hypothetical protein